MITETAIDEVTEELRRAVENYGPFASPHEGYAILLEELDELWEEIRKKAPVSVLLRAEARQVAAMAIRFMIDCTEEPKR
jgi:hypothetical protein